MRRGRNIFLTGPPGSGKSYVLSAYVAWAEKVGRKVALTASTGIAASLLGGITVHSWSGMALTQQLNKYDVDRLIGKQFLKERFNATDILIIDEISMLSGRVLNDLNTLLKLGRNSNLAFGGIQTIFAGDFFQLPPVNAGPIGYAFMSEAWREADLLACYLSEQHRQQSDELTDILLALRDHRLTKRHLDLLLSRQGIRHQPVTMLMTHNRKADAVNYGRLNQIKGDTKSYKMLTFGNRGAIAELTGSILAPKELNLKVGAEVMFIANNFSEGFVNGSQGTVVKFRCGKPVVKLKNSRLKLTVEVHSWKKQINGTTIAEAVQLPLRLSWAITVHKSQGMSLDAAEIDLRQSFAYGMGYVALSRLKSYNGLYLSGLNSRALQLDRGVFAFDDLVRSESQANERLLTTSSKTRSVRHFVRLLS